MTPTSETFGTAGGSLTFAQFGELVSRVWNDAHSDVSMYEFGTDTDDTEYPLIVWKCGGKTTSDRSPNKPRTADNWIGENGKGIMKKVFFCDTIFSVLVKDDDPQRINQIINEFELFMFEFIGAFKKLGAFEVIFLEREEDKIQKVSNRSVIEGRLNYLMVEQRSFITSEDLIEAIEIYVNAITSDIEGEEIYSRID